MNALVHLQEWYMSQCNGDWEHTYGVKIGTFDNPGWWLEVELTHSELEGKSFATVEHGKPADSIEDDPDWFICQLKDNKFVAHGGPLNLNKMVEIFVTWAHSCRPNTSLERTREG
jgi:hypothetical protein